ncbi:HNH endonuclease [Georgenia sp. EYE_87]|uniref:HNH endonuclease n=1 Tax=Georgenia sp. EYE_87 TaxID=2853448 RepID=UPI0020030014|nr:HNH endonuclease [Georgenia sp. EYE_87]MCK6210074.1 HNH endonuclease [Georgenia sp. EYE_87]
MLTVSEDLVLREAIMNLLASRTAEAGGFLTRAELSSFPVGSETRRLIDTSRGIWNPRDLNATLSIVSSPDGPYDDRDVDGGLFRYDYRAGSTAGDNTKLRRALELQLPVILLRKFATGSYVPIFPVYVVDDDLAKRQFVVAVDEALRFIGRPDELSEVERRYAERVTRHRLHQSMFRGMVLHAYNVKCAVCHLKHGDLLDAAHITADSKETGLAVVSNGLSLCKIHHAAYDRNLMGISPDYQVAINRKLLDEVDGPMLKHGLQEMHGARIALPHDTKARPDPERLALRFNTFLSV